MKIGMILDAPFPADYRVEKEAITLVEAGHDVVLFCLDTRHDKKEEKYKGFLIARFPTNLVEYKLSALAYTVPFYHWLMRRKIAAFVERYQPDVLHIHDMVIAPAAISVARNRSRKVVLDLHENRPEIMKEYRHVNRFPGKLLINLNRWAKNQIEVASQVDKVVVVTDLAKKDIVKTTGKLSPDVVVLPNTPSKQFFDLPVEQEIMDRMHGTFNLLYVGDTSERRGTAQLIRVMAMLQEKIPDLMLWIVGKSSFDSELIAIAQKENVSHRVKFEGWQPEKFFPSYITGAALCLSPLKRNPHHDTTYANKIFQYMAYARPVIVSDCPAQADLIREEKCGVVYPAENIQALADAILKLYLDSSLRNELGANAKSAVLERWSWESTSTGLIEMYRDFER